MTQLSIVKDLLHLCIVRTLLKCLLALTWLDQMYKDDARPLFVHEEREDYV